MMEEKEEKEDAEWKQVERASQKHRPLVEFQDVSWSHHFSSGTSLCRKLWDGQMYRVTSHEEKIYCILMDGTRRKRSLSEVEKQKEQTAA